ncbi:MAG: SET domain-containing protein-lysine N-methyltransferase [Gammaproteobacteria bacterium]|nr:SET domain-containing protein-lysine N-methyltransferase [Gammaproteobacteria bacterium]
MAKIILKTSAAHGKGVFASEPIAAGEAILTFSGPVWRRSEADFTTYHLQIGEDLYLGPSSGLDDYVNHCCQPNSGFREGLDLVALRAIQPGEEITWDYSTAIDEADFEGFPCGCGASSCRGRVVSFRDLPHTEQEQLRPWLLPYLKAKYPSGALKRPA